MWRVKCSVCILSCFPKIKISVLRGAWDLGSMEQSFVKVMFNEREINTWSWSVTNESICAIVMKLGKQNRLDISGFPLSNCICNSSFAFMCGCEWHCFPLDLVGWGPWMTTLIHRALALKSIFYRHPLKRIAVNSHFCFIGLNSLDFQPVFIFIECKAFDITYYSEVLTLPLFSGRSRAFSHNTS